MIDRSQLLKGTLDVALLAALGHEPSYGHGLFATLAEAGLPGLADASVYGALRRLESEGMLDSELVQSAAGPARKYYRLTASGRSARREALAAWEELVDAMERVLVGSAA
jgi:PadR family transcriptional regulator PadR